MRLLTHFTLLFCAIVAQFPLSAQTLQYDISTQPAKTGGKLKLEVTLTFIPSRSDTTRFALPQQINWSHDLQNCFRNFKAEGGRALKQDAINIIVVSNKKGTGAPIKLTYQVIQNFPGEQVTVETSCTPIILQDYLHVPGECLFLVPRHYQSFDVTVNWTDLPKGWKIQNSINSGETTQQFKSLDRDWTTTMWVAGDFRILKGTALGKPLFFAIRGTWPFTDETLFNAIQKTVESQRTTWEDTDIPYYSVTMIPFVLTSGHVVGMGRTGRCLGYGMFQSFVVYSAQDCPLDPLVSLFNHEMTHDWIGGKIRIGFDDTKPGLRWLAEGFTEYYALRNRWKSGFITDQQFMTELNEDFIKAHHADPNSEVSNQKMEAAYYTNQAYEEVPYHRGFIIALYFDLAIRQKSKNEETLQNFMLELLEYCQRKDCDLQQNFDVFTETLSEHTGTDPTEFIQKHAELGKRITPGEFITPDFIIVKTSALGVPKFSIKPGMEAAFKKG